MSVFLTLFLNLLPLYILIGIGYIAGRYLSVDRHSLGTMAIYIFMPVVVFGFIANLEFKPSYVILPVVIFTIQVAVTLIFLGIGKRVFKDNQANLMAMCASMGNAGYFGLPLVLLFFDKELVAIYIFMMLGGLIFESTIGYYIAARGNFSMRDSFIKLVKLPAIYAMIAGFSINAMQVDLPEIFWTYWEYFKGAYVLIGMMIIGVALSKVEKLVFGPRFIALVFCGKFIAWPLIAFAFISFDKAILQWFEPDIYSLVVMMSIVPPAANIVAFASQLNMNPEKAATTVLIGTIFALFYIPAIIWLLGV